MKAFKERIRAKMPRSINKEKIKSKIKEVTKKLVRKGKQVARGFRDSKVEDMELEAKICEFRDTYHMVKEIEMSARLWVRESNRASSAEKRFFRFQQRAMALIQTGDLQQASKVSEEEITEGEKNVQRVKDGLGEGLQCIIETIQELREKFRRVKIAIKEWEDKRCMYAHYKGKTEKLRRDALRRDQLTAKMQARKDRNDQKLDSARVDYTRMTDTMHGKIQEVLDQRDEDLEPIFEVAAKIALVYHQEMIQAFKEHITNMAQTSSAQRKGKKSRASKMLRKMEKAKTRARKKETDGSTDDFQKKGLCQDDSSGEEGDIMGLGSGSGSTDAASPSTCTTLASPLNLDSSDEELPPIGAAETQPSTSGTIASPNGGSAPALSTSDSDSEEESLPVQRRAAKNNPSASSASAGGGGTPGAVQSPALDNPDDYLAGLLAEKQYDLELVTSQSANRSATNGGPSLSNGHLDIVDSSSSESD